MKRLALGFVAVLVLTSAAFAQEASKLPAGTELFERFRAAIGGKEALKKLDRSISKSQLTIVQQGITGTSTTYADGKRRVSETDFAAMGLFLEGTDGEIYWENNPTSGPRILEGNEKRMREIFSTLETAGEFEKFVDKTETVGEEPVDGKPAYKVLCTMKEGIQPITLWFDQATGLLSQIQVTAETPMGVFPVIGTMSDYRDVHGVKVPHLASQKLMGIEIQTRVLSIEIVEKHDEGRFDLPAPVQQLVDLKKQQAEKAKAAEKEKPAAEGGATPK